ncbi:MAG: hypothetical protein Q9163_005579 [Psora crenata]
MEQLATFHQMTQDEGGEIPTMDDKLFGTYVEPQDDTTYTDGASPNTILPPAGFSEKRNETAEAGPSTDLATRDDPSEGGAVYTADEELFGKYLELPDGPTKTYAAPRNTVVPPAGSSEKRNETAEAGPSKDIDEGFNPFKGLAGPVNPLMTNPPSVITVAPPAGSSERRNVKTPRKRKMTSLSSDIPEFPAITTLNDSAYQPFVSTFPTMQKTGALPPNTYMPPTGSFDNPDEKHRDWHDAKVVREKYNEAIQRRYNDTQQPHYNNSFGPRYNQHFPQQNYNNPPQLQQYYDPRPPYQQAPQPRYYDTPRPQYHQGFHPEYSDTPRPNYHEAPQMQFSRTPQRQEMDYLHEPATLPSQWGR